MCTQHAMRTKVEPFMLQIEPESIEFDTIPIKNKAIEHDFDI